MTARRKRSSWGCVTRLAPGVYRLRWTDSGRRRSETVHGSRREADDRLAALRVACGSAPSRRVPTVAEAYERHYLPDLKGRVVPHTVKTMESMWRAVVGPKWGSIRLDDVRPLELQEWLLTLTSSQAKDAVRLLSGVYKRAMLFELVDRSPVTPGLRMPDRRALRRTSAVIAEGDLEAYHAASVAADVEAVFVLACCCGLRVGESLGVRVGEVERDGSTGQALAVVPVARQVDDAGEVLERLKTQRSARWAACGEPWASRLLALQDAAAARGDAWLVDDGLGNPRSQRSVRRAWERAVRDAGLGHMPLQNLRATFASRMEGRVPVESIARLMGHAKPTITFKTYERPDRSTFVRAAAAAAVADT